MTSHDIRSSTKTHKMGSNTALTTILNLTAMELKILLIAVVFIGASAAFSLPEEQEDASNEYEAQELEGMSSDEPEYDLEDPFLGRRRFCPKLYVRRCYVVRHCYRYIRICRCVPWRLGDETEIDNQLNDETLEAPEDEAENSDETNQELEDPSRIVPKPKPSKCLKNLIRRCFLVKYGKSRRLVCACVRPCTYKG